MQTEAVRLAREVEDRGLLVETLARTLPARTGPDSIDDLIAMKQAAGSAKDLLDVDELEVIKRLRHRGDAGVANACASMLAMLGVGVTHKWNNTRCETTISETNF